MKSDPYIKSLRAIQYENNHKLYSRPIVYILWGGYIVYCYFVFFPVVKDFLPTVMKLVTMVPQYHRCVF